MTYRELPPRLQAYIAFVCVLGLASLALVARFAPPDSPVIFGALVVTAVVFSTWGVQLSVRDTKMTLTSAAVVLAMLLEGAWAAVTCAAVGAVLGTVVQSGHRLVPRIEWKPGHRFQLPFNVANCVVASVLGACAYEAISGGQTPATLDVRLAGAALGFQLVHFLANTLGLSIVVALTKRRPVLEVWRQNFLWAGPSYFVSASLAVTIWAAYSHPLVGTAALLLVAPLYFIYYFYRLHHERIEQDQRHIAELNELNHAIIASLATAIDAKDRYTRSHINRVQMYAVALAEAVGLSGAELEAVRMGALIHDIGKLGIPERILGKPGKLTMDEFRRMQAHVTIGAEILAPVPFPFPVLPIVLTHHERWDGLGYPKGLKAEEIPIGGRIMAIADVFDALTSDRPYRTAMSTQDAVAVLREGAGRQFDPNLVEHFARILPEVRARVEEMEAKLAVAAASETGTSGEMEPNWALRQISQAASEMSATCELAQGLAETSSVEEVVQVVVDRALRLLPADTAAVYLCDEESGELRARAVRGLYAEKLAGLSIARGEGVSGWVGETLQSQINAAASLDIARRFTPTEQMELTAASAVPLVQGSTTVGVLTLYTTGYSVMNEHHLGVLNVLAEHAAAALVSARRYEQTRELSLSDPLTGLPNSRSLFHHVEALCHHWRGEEPTNTVDRFSVLMFDLDGFKHVNDTRGHLRGDELLQQFAEILRGLCRERDLPCRYAGDEFVVVLAGADLERAHLFAERVRELLAQRSKAWLPSGLGVSFGAASFPTDGQDVRSLLAVADERMYNDKFTRRNRVSRNLTGEDDLSVPRFPGL